jgi:uncharacterized C2H2 Zn-finger protein
MELACRCGAVFKTIEEWAEHVQEKHIPKEEPEEEAHNRTIRRILDSQN